MDADLGMKTGQVQLISAPPKGENLDEEFFGLNRLCAPRPAQEHPEQRNLQMRV